MPIYKGNTNQGLIYYGSPNTNCLTSVPKNVKLELTYGAWTQPIFSSNTNGGLTLSASHESTPAWYAFNGDKTTNDNCWWTDHGVTSTSNPCWIQLKSAIKLKLNQVVIRNEHNTPENFKTAYLQVSNDGSSWTNVVTISGTNTGGYETTVNFTVSDGYYYYRLYFTESYSSGGVSIQTITFSGIAQNILTLKAGSKVYVPNGFESDGTTPKFDEVVIGSDIAADTKGYSGLYCYNTAGWFSILSDTVSGSALNNPSVLQGWYDTANNIIKRYHTSGWQQPFSFPICKVTSDGTNITSIDQVFDWCGFIGSTAFVLPGVKGLKSNGIKADGTYNNIEIETKSVLLNHYDYQATGQQFGLGGNGNSVWRTDKYYSQPTAPTPAAYSVWHNTIDNFNYSIEADTSTGWVKNAGYDFNVANSISTDSSFKITSLAQTTVQPLSTGIQITKVYKGSTLVYHLGFDPVTFTENGTWTVPEGIRQIRVDCVAAQGWSYNTTYIGGLGGRVQCILNVTPKQTLYIKVGHHHATAGDNTYDASDIRTADADLNSRLIVAGAGGGSGVYWADQAKYYNGGAGGGLTGGTGGNVAGAANNNLTIGYGAGGGTQTAGGAGARFSMYLKSLTAGSGAFGYGGDGNDENSNNRAGAGGAGWYGGGGAVSGGYWASSSAHGSSAAAAGGGSSYTHPTLCSEVVHTQGFQTGNGYVTISMV